MSVKVGHKGTVWQERKACHMSPVIRRWQSYDLALLTGWGSQAAEPECAEEAAHLLEP
jgi:hypothetical protein